MSKRNRVRPTGLVAVLLTVFVALPLCAQSYLNPPFTIDFEITQWIRTRALPFRMASPFDPTPDLSALRDLVGDARMVAVGEATHGTHEFFEIKAQMFRYLAEEMGFTLFTMESPASGCTRMNRYLSTGEGDLDELMDGIIFLFQTVEYRDLFAWMRMYNQTVAPDAQLQVQGLDMQHSADSMDVVADFLRDVHPTGADELLAGYEAYRVHAYDMYAYSAMPAGDKEALRAGLQVVYDWIAAHRNECKQMIGVRGTNEALYNARVVLQQEAFSSQLGDFVAAGVIRDRFMAENALWWLDVCGPESRMLMSNHNMHVSKGVFGGLNTGEYLSQALGDDLVIFATSSYDGSVLVMGNDPVRRLGLEEMQLVLPGEMSVEYAFRSTRIPRFFLDLRGIEPGEAGADWLLGTWPFYGTYTTAFNGSAAPMHIPLTESFDAIIHFQVTTPAYMLPTGGCQPEP